MPEIRLELEYRKLITEYNATLIALASVPLAIGGLIYNSTRDILFTFVSLFIAYLILNTVKNDKSEELDNKVKELKKL